MSSTGEKNDNRPDDEEAVPTANWPHLRELTNAVLYEKIEHLLTRPVGRPPKKPIVLYEIRVSYDPNLAQLGKKLYGRLIRHYLGRRFIAGARYEPTTYQIFMSGSAWPTIDKS